MTIAWVNQSGDEGASAEAAVVTTTGSTLLVEPGRAPQNATGWNVYVGTAPDGMILQSAAPIPADDSWLQPNSLAGSGRKPGDGQSPSYMLAIPRVIPRG